MNPLHRATPALLALAFLIACATPEPQAWVTTPGAPAAVDPIFRGERQVTIIPVGSLESVLAVNSAGRLTHTDGDTDDKGLFVLVPLGDGRFQIKTATAPAGRQPSCMRVKTDGADPPTVVAAPCDVAAPDQTFTIALQRPRDYKGRPTYTIAAAGGVHLVKTREGLIVQKPGDAGLTTTFSIVDNGPVGA